MVRIHTIALNGKISLGKVIKFVTKFNGAFALPKSSWCVHEFQGAAGGFQLIMNTALFDLFISENWRHTLRVGIVTVIVVQNSK